jgi:Mrp family chromosome partitioning ATPase
MNQLHSELKIAFPKIEFIRVGIGENKINIVIRNSIQESEREIITRFIFERFPLLAVRFVQDTNVANISIGKVICIGAGKGGVGKSSITAQLAHHWAAHGINVGVIDADIYGPSMSRMLNIHAIEVHADANGKIQPIQSTSMKSLCLLSFEFWLESHASVLWRSNMACAIIKEFIFTADWSQCDIILIDLPPGTGDINLLILESIQSSCIVITTPQLVVQDNVSRFVQMLNGLAVPITETITNMCEYSRNPLEIEYNSTFAAACDTGELYPKIKELAYIIGRKIGLNKLL